MRRKVGIIGGAFNPPHNAHIKLGKYALGYFHLQELIYIPTNIPPHKPIDSLWNGNIRSLMIKAAIYYEAPERILEDLQKIAPPGGREGIETFVNKYKEGYKKYHNAALTVSDIEIQSNGMSFTIDTVRKILKNEPDADLYIIIGMDQAAVLDTWKDYSVLSQIAVFCAAGRPGTNADKVKKRFPLIRVFPFPLNNISSSLIRQRLDEGKSVGGMVPPIINDLIKLLQLIAPRGQD